MKHELLSVVVFLEDVGDARKGERGTVVETFETPEEGYIVELTNESGTDSRLIYNVKPEQIDNA